MIIITGISTGLGKELASIYAAAGKHVVGLSRKGAMNGIDNITIDLKDEYSINQAVEKILTKPTPIEALINCAGVFSVEKLESLSSKEIDKVFDTNIRGPMLLTSKLIDRIKTDGADIVNVASSIGFKGYSEQGVYGSSKWALRGFSVYLQTELKNTPCRVISFCPGGFKSNLYINATGVDQTAGSNEWMSPAELAKFMKQILDLPKNMEVSEVVINRKVV